MAIAYGPVVSAGPYALPIIATVLALVMYAVYTYRVGMARIKHNIPAPAMTGPDDFARVIRIHANQLEQTVPFIASLWLFSLFVSPVIGFALALVWLERRWHYSDYYTANGYNKGLGAYTVPAYMVINVYLLGSLVAALLSFVA